MPIPCPTPPPPAKPQGILALPGDWASSIGPESWGRGQPHLYYSGRWGKQTDFPFPSPSGWFPTSQPCYLEKRAGSETALPSLDGRDARCAVFGCQHQESQESAWLQDPASCWCGQKVSVGRRLCGWHPLDNCSWYISFVKSLPGE